MDSMLANPDTTPAASVSLACCQSLCDLLKELPLPQPLLSVSDQCLSARNNNVCHNLSLLDSQLESALFDAKHQLAELVFNDAVVASVVSVTPLSPLATQLSLKGLFFGVQNNCWPQLETSLETIEPSIRTQLELTENLKLINELQNDCNDADGKYFHNNEDDSYSSLGERVKSRQRQHASSAQSPLMPSVVVSPEPPPVVEPPPARPERPPKTKADKTPTKSHNSHKSRNHSTNSNNKYESKDISLDLQNKDSLVSFEYIINKVMSDCVDDTDDDDDDNSDDDRDVRNDRKNDMSFDLRIDLKELNALMSLSSKLKHSNRMNDLEHKLSSKLSSFLSLLTNKMTVWFSKFKETEELTTSDDTYQSSDDNHFWQLLINASKMSLNIMTSKGMSSRVVLFEELLEIIINFLSHNLNSKTHVTSKSPSKSKKASSVTTTVATKRQVTHWTELLELLCEYLQRNQSLNDSIVLMCTRIAMNSLFLNSTEMQFISTPILAQIFAQYPKHRASILEELLQQFHRIPVQKHHQKHGMNAFTRLLIQLTNALFTCGVDARTRITRDVLAKQLTECMQIMAGFLSSLTRRCLCADADAKQFFWELIQDLLQNIYSPQNITALLLVQILTKLLITCLTQNSKSTQLAQRLNAIEFLAEICSTFARFFAQKEQLIEESDKTLRQLLGRDDDASDDSDDDKTRQMLKLLNEFMNCEKLLAEKWILSSLWMKEKRIQEIETQFLAILNAKFAESETEIDVTIAELFIKCLEISQFQTISRLFDASLSHVTSSLSLTSNTTQRSRAMKSLSQILVNCSLEKSTQLLARSDLQMAMRSALLDASTSVREATVDLIGRFVLQSKSMELCDKYCDLIGERILDTGVSVRKRVIKILRDICIAFPEFAKCGELQLKVIKRVNDEGEGIRKLVLETVRDLWFRSLNDTTTTTSDAQTVVSHKVMSLLHVISVMLQNDGSIDSLHQLIEQIVKNDCELSSAQTIVDFVVARVLTAAEPPPTHGAANRALINLAAIHLVAIFARISPQILVKHCDSLQSLLSLSCDTIVDIHLRNKLIQSLERILQRVSHPSQQLMTRLEEDLTKQILQSSALILPSSVKCLAVVIAFHTKNFKLSTDLFHKFKQYMLASRDPQNKPRLLRSIYSLGLFVKHFAKHFDSQSKQLILDHILALIQSQVDDGLSDSDVIVRCVTSLGFIIESDPKICLQRRVIELYLRLLAEGAGDCFCAQVLTNFRNYLNESLDEDERVNKAIEWSRESLKTMTSEDCDSNSTQSQIIQTYLTPILDKSISASAHIRRVACNVVHVIHSGGHVHPLQLVPHLIAMTTDDDRDIRSRADHVLHEIERKFHGFVAMKARAGILLATELCARVKCRGYRLLDDNSGDVTSRLATLYHVVCTNRQSRRGFVQQLLRNFEVTSSPTTTTDDTAVYESSATTETTHDDQSTTSDDQSIQLVFEMLLFFPFTVCDEIMYILQQLECIQSVNSTHTSQLFTELFGFESEEQMDDKFDDNYDTFANDLRENETTIVCRQQVLKQIQRSLRRVFLVSILRKLLKEFYLIKDEKILEYSPNEPKVWEKPIHRRQIESSNLCETLSLASPALGVEPKIDDLLEELKRFKSVSLTSNDPNISNALINQKLFQIKKRVESQSKAFTIEANHRTTQMDDELNESERKRLLDSIRKTSCHVKLIDISLTPQTTAATTERTESVAKRKDRKSPKKEKRKRIRVEDDTSDDQTTDDDNHYDTDDDDRH